MLVALQLLRPVAGHLADDRVGHPLDEEHGRGEVPQVVDAEVVDSGEVADSSEPLTEVPGVRLGELLNVFESDVGFCRKQVFMLPVAWKLAEGINGRMGQYSDFPEP